MRDMGEGATLGRMVKERLSKSSHFKGNLNDVYYLKDPEEKH